MPLLRAAPHTSSNVQRVLDDDTLEIVEVFLDWLSEGQTPHDKRSLQSAATLLRAHFAHTVFSEGLLNSRLPPRLRSIGR